MNNAELLNVIDKLDEIYSALYDAGFKAEALAVYEASNSLDAQLSERLELEGV